MKGPTTPFRGKYRINGIWESEDVHCYGAIFISLWKGVGDIRAFVFDMYYKALIR